MKSTHNSTVLIVDDIRVNRQLLGSVLADYNVLEAESGEMALAMVAENLPDIILLDIKMPGIDGFEVCKMLQSSPETIGIPVIFITGNDEPGQAGRCFEIGAVDFLAKPFDLNEVNARVHTHLSLKMAKESLVEQNKLLEDRVNEQRLNIKLASRVLSLINPQSPSMINLGNKDYLYTKVMGRSCKEEGGDHYMIKNIPGDVGGGKTLVSVKDQSGHAVNCILRCLITDLLHNSSIYTTSDSSLVGNVTLLNNAICESSLFKEDDFFTAMFMELDHKSRKLQYVSAGHPPFLLIRNGEVCRLPSSGDAGSNLPMAFQEGVIYKAGELVLQTGDKLLLYTDGLTDMPMAGPNSKSVSADELTAMVAEIVQLNKEITVSSLVIELLEEMRKLTCDDGTAIDAIDLVDDVTLLGMEVECLDTASQQRNFVPNDYDSIDSMIDHIITLTIDKIAACGGQIDEFRLRMALSEGVVNAFNHGNSKDCALPILVGWQHGNDFLISIKDMGSGVDLDSLLNPVCLENRLSEGGRGVFCMRKYADCVGWQEGGSTLLLTFSITEHPWTLQRSGTEAAINLWGEPLPSC